MLNVVRVQKYTGWLAKGVKHVYFACEFPLSLVIKVKLCQLKSYSQDSDFFFLVCDIGLFFLQS